ncbi:hypothetical protein K466DRAFT_598374 [Polyporus arcularius HHB13444]|uniref:Uncharacterized protein n=1 Tax=Polyporus arcularius HHB13444 TaxID=1314778 RepID=A0A5C3PRL9_9APHY|nr:hypothetical protein K466DRAFT_598374 [Polyporus arcularius HHB13444]
MAVDSGNTPPPASSDGGAPLPEKRKHEEDEKVLKPTVGKVPKGEDFWSKIDRRLDFAVQTWGESLTTPQWREYIDETLALDRNLFGRCTSGVLPPISMQVTTMAMTPVPTPSAVPLPGPSTTPIQHRSPSPQLTQSDFSFTAAGPSHQTPSTITPPGLAPGAPSMSFTLSPVPSPVPTPSMSARSSIWE